MERILSILGGNDGRDLILEKKDKRSQKKVKKLKVKPLFPDADDFIAPPHPNLLEMPFSLLEIAVKGSGKTTLLHNLMLWYHNYFDNVFIFSPTIQLDHKWQEIIELLDIPEDNLFQNCSEAQVSSLVGQIKDFNSGLPDNEKIHSLLIFDDCLELLPKGKKRSFINKLSMNHRHYKISHIMISQTFKKLDTAARVNTSGTILFLPDNIAERKKIIEELCGNLGNKRFEQLWCEICKEKFNFMYINNQQRKIFKNFDEEMADLSLPPTDNIFSK